MKYKKTLTVALVCFVVGLTSGIYIEGIDIPFLQYQDQWAIAIYSGKSPLELVSHTKADNPVLTAEHINDVEALFVADPFMINDKNKWYMFFEVMNTGSCHGDIGLATSDDGITWSYERIVLDEPFHLSYPYVFKWKADFYMIPECQRQTNAIRLYKADDFPAKWSLEATLLDNLSYYADPCIFRYDGKWWILVQAPWSGFLSLYYAERLIGPWTEHPQSPVVFADTRISRPGGRVLVTENKILRFAQDGQPHYGSSVRAFEITELTPERYAERELIGPVLQASGTGWNAKGMHHIDPHKIADNQWVACVDGHRKILLFRF